MTFPWLFHDSIPFSMTKKIWDTNDSNAANQIMYSLIQYLMQIVPCKHKNTASSYRVFIRQLWVKIYRILCQSCLLIIHSLKFLSLPTAFSRNAFDFLKRWKPFFTSAYFARSVASCCIPNMDSVKFSFLAFTYSKSSWIAFCFLSSVCATFFLSSSRCWW